MIVNHFNMRTDVQSYHLGGMGCSNGVVAVNLIKDLLKVSVCAGCLWGLALISQGNPRQHALWTTARARLSSAAC